ncbi:MAG: hypothetical protein R2874_14730 [Desulfobacterales bacterium]
MPDPTIILDGGYKQLTAEEILEILKECFLKGGGHGCFLSLHLFSIFEQYFKPFVSIKYD